MAPATGTEDLPGMADSPRGGRGLKARRTGIIAMALLVVAIVAAVAGANAWKRGLRVSGVRVENNEVVSSAEILRLAGISKGAALFEVDLGAVRERIRKNPFIRSVAVNRQGPAGLTITVEERQPLALLAKEQLLYVDEEGMVLPDVRTERLFDLPVLTGAIPGGDCVPGHRLTGAPIREALELLTLTRAMGDEAFHRVSEVHLREGGDLILHTADAGVPVLVGRGGLKAKLAKLDAFWRQIVEQRGPQNLRLVDLRYEDQVVARWSDMLARQ